jgi:hypothetical protein
MNRTKVKVWQRMLLFCVLLLVSQQLFAQVRGKVSDASGMSIPGATIQEKGTTNGINTDADGKYQIKVTNPQTSVLVFSFVGMETQEIPVSGRTTINVTMGESVVKIDDVVVVGYGSQKKASVVAAISTISSADIVRSTTANLTVGLAGKLPGLTIMEKDGAWNVTFENSKRGPAKPVVFKSLSDWTLSINDSIKYFSGTAVYKTSVSISQIPIGKKILLNLGQLTAMAKVKVNGKEVGGVWTAPWQVDISAVVIQGINEVEISVVNNWMNRLIGDQKLPVDQRPTWSPVIPYNTESPLQPSGLFGPVKILSTN